MTSTAATHPYVANVASACALVTMTHLALGLGLAKHLNGQQFKGFPLYTYYHSMIHTGLVFPAFLVFFAVTAPSRWLEGPDGATHTDELDATQWVQASNIGFQVAITLLSPREVFGSPALLLHHAITILGCVALLHPLHCAGYGAVFTAFTEFGSTFHNIMSLNGGTASRLLRIATDIITRGGGLVLMASEFPISRARGLPMYLQIWTCLGGLAWFGINASWTVQVASGLWRRRGRKERKE
jgi:hypothetical protein